MATRQHADYNYIDVPSGNIKGSNASRIESWVEYKVTVGSTNATVDVYMYAQLKSNQSSTTSGSTGTCTIIVGGVKWEKKNISYNFGNSKTTPIEFGHNTFTVPLQAQVNIDATWTTPSTYITSATIPTTIITIIEAIGRIFAGGSIKTSTPYIFTNGEWKIARPYIRNNSSWRASI